MDVRFAFDIGEPVVLDRKMAGVVVAAQVRANGALYEVSGWSGPMSFSLWVDEFRLSKAPVGEGAEAGTDGEAQPYKTLADLARERDGT